MTPPARAQPLGIKAKSMQEFSRQQEAFIRGVIEHGNLTRAAKEAGYRERNAGSQGSKLAKDPNIAAEIVKRREQLLDDSEAMGRRIRQELAVIAFSNMADFLPEDGKLNWSTLDRMKLAAVAECTVYDYAPGANSQDRRTQALGMRPTQRVKFKLHDKLAALTTLAKIYGLYDEKPDDRETVITVVYKDRPIRGAEEQIDRNASFQLRPDPDTGEMRHSPLPEEYQVPEKTQSADVFELPPGTNYEDVEVTGATVVLPNNGRGRS